MKELKDIKNITVIGCGLMGSAIAQTFAAKGFPVATYDVNPNADVLGQVSTNCDFLINGGAMTYAEKENALANITFTPELEKAVKDADIIIESVFERIDVKHDVLTKIEALCRKDAIISSNTSAISITKLAEPLKNKARFVGTHFWNPGHLIPLVEIIRSDYTDDTTFDLAYELIKSVGKAPVKCKKDVPGFIGNRLQAALWREAIYIVEQGIADAATVDETVKNGFGLRLPQIGPMENMDLIGLDLSRDIHTTIFPDLCNASSPQESLLNKIEEGRLGFKSGEGFQKWTPEEAKASRAGLSDYLVKVRKVLDK